MSERENYEPVPSRFQFCHASLSQALVHALNLQLRLSVRCLSFPFSLETSHKVLFGGGLVIRASVFQPAPHKDAMFSGNWARLKKGEGVVEEEKREGMKDRKQISKKKNSDTMKSAENKKKQTRKRTCACVTVFSRDFAFDAISRKNVYDL